MRFSLLLLCLWMTGCYVIQLSDFSHTDTPPPSPIKPTPDAWQQVAPGLEKRTYRTDTGLVYEAVRIDPTQHSFRVHYRPGQPLGIGDWQTTLPNAAIIVNANFFATDNTILGLLISDGVVYGRSYSNRGGTFFVQNGRVGIRSNSHQPYQGEAYEQAVQAFPMLVYDGQPAYNNSRDTLPSRRTIIGQDADGRVILMVTPALGHSLYGLSQYLVATDIGFVHAFNLDGGGSTMMYRAFDGYFLYSIDPIPAVLAVYSQN